MTAYRLYFLDGNNHIRSALNLEGADDDHAILLAREHSGAAMELWQGARLVTRLETSAMREAG